jgi:phage/plasmid primase-like uncharacterized protein
MMTALEIAQRLNLKASGRAEWRGTCPACGYANNSFVLTDKGGKALVWCASCQDKAAIAKAVGIGRSAAPACAPVADATRTGDKQAMAGVLWRASRPAVGTLVATYLAARGLPGLAGSDALRFCPACRHIHGATFPAMVALVEDAGGEPVAIHRTWLRPDGIGKAAVEPAKASLGPVWGGAIRLQPHDPARPLVVGEGIETAASAGRLMDSPAWSALSAGNLGRGLSLPPDVRSVIIAVDPDRAGRAAAREAGARWQAEGRAVRFAIPAGAGDFNDMLLAREASHA